MEWGEAAKARWIEVELKSIADVGLVGLPNAGKSSLLSAVTNKYSKVAAYPFSTIKPEFGVFAPKDDPHKGSITLADIPGLIEGSHLGQGLGIMFLRHIERCRTLLHVVAGDSEDPLRDFNIVQDELEKYSTEMKLKPQVVVINKCDLPEVQERLPKLMAAIRKRAAHSRVFEISVATRHNLDELMKRLYKWHKSVLEKEWADKGAPAEDASFIVSQNHLFQLGGDIGQITKKEFTKLDPELPKGRRTKSSIEGKIIWDVLEEAWRIIHPEVEKVAQQTRWDLFNPEGRGPQDGYEAFNKICKATGITDLMHNIGIKEGEPIYCRQMKFHYAPSQEGRESRMLYFDMELDALNSADA